VVTRKDLPLTTASIQGCHAAIDFQHQHPELAKHWQQTSNYLVFLSTDNEETLNELINKAKLRDILYTKFNEPDLNNELTAVAFEPSEASRKLLSNLPLMRKEVTND